MTSVYIKELTGMLYTHMHAHACMDAHKHNFEYTTVNDQLVARCQTAAGSHINAEGPTAFCQIHACLQ